MVDLAVLSLLTQVVVICTITLAQAQEGTSPPLVQVNFYGRCLSMSSRSELSSQQAPVLTETCQLQGKPCARTVPDL